jgi:hypothetical protein
VADDEKSFMAKVVAGLITAIDPGANLGLVDKAAGIKTGSRARTRGGVMYNLVPGG